ncbi:uncharacterized protein [Onthophagus taurus]|uniref:uncharacterized protein n=1 Tax=Onthophagus taurus TaxID=166361 RepID=UPI0039BDDE2E
MEIRNIEQLLEPYLQNDESNQKQEVIKCVAKLVPPRGILWDIFDTVSTFKKEIAVYNTIVPALNQFGREHGIECILPYFAEYCNSRVTLQPNSCDVDDDAVLLLNNLQEDGYEVEDRFVGFDKESVIMIIKSLATLHATSIAYKLSKPDEFQNKVLKHIEKCLVGKLDETAQNTQIDCFKTFLAKYPNLTHLSQRMINSYRQGIKKLCQERTPIEPFATFVHGDLWTNNILIKSINKNPVSIKFVDFQVIEYGNPARDVIFFLYTSAQMELLQLIDDYLLIYHNHFIDTLKLLNCDPNPFNYDTFLKQIDDAAKEMEFAHVMFILPPVFTEKGKAVELSDMKDQNDIVSSVDRIHVNYQSRFAFVLEDFAKRGWI